MMDCNFLALSICRVTLYSPNPEKLGCKPNEPNIINL